ncbi:hypothetical protein AXG93_4368s1560 [Marchantia polymorpha subsp. ruderalis]|uniref:GFO/IDH/MocA-like oxidoreductase domain-containing protein n=1 Tax=Marchantia polymorpha subsp. ruderalis TaxID=1480154 RepID=A0A176W0H5_MARPO|nr:hypothetical protein AXG93_4368s1560 [Marchantia polymorpha subsp. ruderalis]
MTMAMLEATPVLALLGCGIFARDAYLPILQNIRTCLSLQVVWSRTQASAESLLSKVREFSPKAEAEWGEEGLEQKPIAGTMSEGIKSLRNFTSHFEGCEDKTPIWAVAENFRFEPAFYKAQKIISSLGSVVVVQVNIEVPMNAKSKYFESEWRRDPDLKGAFITDCGVHFVAGLRAMMGGNDIVSVAAITTHRDALVPPPDTLTALMKFRNGFSGVMVITYSSSNYKASWRVVCSEGSVEVERGFKDSQFGYTVTYTPLEGKGSSEFVPLYGLEAELRAFASDVQRNILQVGLIPDWRSSPPEALQDLAIIETCLASGSRKDAPVAMGIPLSDRKSPGARNVSGLQNYAANRAELVSGRWDKTTNVLTPVLA